MLRNTETLQRILKSDQGFRYFETIRGSPEYWNKTMKDLFALIRSLGIPTWFLTLSSAELSRWTCHLGAILRQQGLHLSEQEISDLTYLRKCEILKSNPVTCIRQFYHRFNLFMKHILLGKSQHIGPVKDYWYRIEFQARGAALIICWCGQKTLLP